MVSVSAWFPDGATLLHPDLRRGRHAALPGSDPELVMRRRRMDHAHPTAHGGLRGHVPARPGWSHTSSPVPVRRPASLDGAASRPHRAGVPFPLFLACGGANTWRQDVPLARAVPYPAHTLRITCWYGAQRNTSQVHPVVRCGLESVLDMLQTQDQPSP